MDKEEPFVVNITDTVFDQDHFDLRVKGTAKKGHPKVIRDFVMKWQKHNPIPTNGWYKLVAGFFIVSEPTNEEDPHALAVYLDDITSGSRVGYIPKPISAEWTSAFVVQSKVPITDCVAAVLGLIIGTGGEIPFGIILRTKTIKWYIPQSDEEYIEAQSTQIARQDNILHDKPKISQDALSTQEIVSEPC